MELPAFQHAAPEAQADAAKVGKPHIRIYNKETNMIQGATALVTGSTIGIGLGIGNALAEADAKVVLSGFGNAADIERIRRVFLCSSGAAFITGASIPMEGGWTAR